MQDSTLLRMKSINDRVSFLRGKEHTDTQTVASIEKVLDLLETDILEIGKVLKVLGKLADNMAQKDLGVINGLVNYGLKVVFPDRDLEFVARMVEVDGKMQVHFETFDTGKLVDSDTYGSVSTVESLLLRVICMVKTKVGKLLLLDETFSAMDHDYIIRVGVLLKELAFKMKMDILLATFNASESEADTVLRAKYSKSTHELSVSTYSPPKVRGTV